MTKEKELLLANAGLRQLVRSLRYEQGRLAAEQFALLKGFAATRGSLDEFWKQWNNETEDMISQAQSPLQHQAIWNGKMIKWGLLLETQQN